MDELAIKIEGLKKQYKLGAIGGGTLSSDLQTWWARIQGKEDPNSKIGEDSSKYGERFWALNGIDLEIKKGEAIGIIGHNGAGKSTLLKLLSRVTAPTEGIIKINGRISSMLEVGTGFHPELTGRENIYMNGAILGMSKKEVDEKIDEIIEFSECRQFIDTPVKRYSSGMYVKLAFSVAAHLDSDIMIMDEVLAVGDVQYQKKCLTKMSEASQREGKTILYVSHNMSTIQRLCKRCIVLEHGKIVFDGNTDAAIKIYLNSNVSGDSVIDMNNLERYDGMTGKVKMTRLQISGETGLTVGMNQYLEFCLDYELIHDTGNMMLKMCVRYQDTSPVGVFLLKGVEGGKAGEHKKVIFRMYPKDLAPGEYDFRMILMELEDNGLELGHDGVTWFGKFEVVQNLGDMCNLRWWHSTYGHCYLGEMMRI